MEDIIENRGTMPDIDQPAVDSHMALDDDQPNLQRIKRKHRRGKPKPKNSNWKFQAPRFQYNNNSGGGGIGPNQRQRARAKLIRSNSLAPYNTNKFLMEEHMVEVPFYTPSGRTRDSSFCTIDSEDNYFFSLPEDEEDFLTKEFSNVYEKARIERLESLSKQELLQECLQIEDRCSAEQGAQNQLNIQRITSEFMSRIKSLEQKIKELSRENYNLRCQVIQVKTNTLAAAASPPSAAAPTTAACQPVPMESSSEDTESDSSSSSSSSSTSSSSTNRQSCPSDSSIEEHEAYIANRQVIDAERMDIKIADLSKEDNSNANDLCSARNEQDHSEGSANSNSCLLSPKQISSKSPLAESNEFGNVDSASKKDICN